MSTYFFIAPNAHFGFFCSKNLTYKIRIHTKNHFTFTDINLAHQLV